MARAALADDTWAGQQRARRGWEDEEFFRSQGSGARGFRGGARAFHDRAKSMWTIISFHILILLFRLVHATRVPFAHPPLGLRNLSQRGPAYTDIHRLFARGRARRTRAYEPRALVMHILEKGTGCRRLRACQIVPGRRGKIAIARKDYGAIVWGSKSPPSHGSGSISTKCLA